MNKIIQAKKECLDVPYCEISNICKQLKAKEQECEGLKKEIKNHNDDMFKNPPEKRFYCKGCTLPYISKKLELENKHLNDLLNQALKELEELQEGLENG